MWRDVQKELVRQAPQADEIRALTVVATIVDGIPAYRGDPVTYSPLED